MLKLSWSKVTLDQYIEIQDLHLEGITGIDFILEVGDLLLDVSEEPTERELDEVKQAIRFVFTEPNEKVEDEIGGCMLRNFKRLTYGQWIDLDVSLTENSLPEALPKVVPVLYEDLDSEGLMVGQVIGAVRSFVKYRQDTIKQYEDLFDSGEDEEEDEKEVKPEGPKESASQMWMRTVYQLADGDVTKAKDILKLPHRLVLNWVAMSESLKSRQQSPTV